MAAAEMELKNTPGDQAQLDKKKCRATPVSKECPEMEEPVKGMKRNQVPDALEMER